jgi:CRP/FNR family transcriptional regulator, cyclic AMP receptor protein
LKNFSDFNMDITGTNVLAMIRQHSLFVGLSPEDVELIADCGHEVGFPAGQLMFRQGDRANAFYLILQGQVAIEISAPGQPAILIKTMGDQDVLGWDWLFPPYVWEFDVRAITQTKAIALDGLCLRGKCDQNPALGYELMQRFSSLMLDSLRATQLQLLDVYGLPSQRAV